MIKATVIRTVWDKGVTGYMVKAEGHAGAGKYGSDIVCSAVSVLMQTLANEVEEAARAGVIAMGNVAHGNGWMKVEVQPNADCFGDMAAAWVEFVQDGLDAIAQSYPDHVELELNNIYAGGNEPDPDELADIADIVAESVFVRIDLPEIEQLVDQRMKSVVILLDNSQILSVLLGNPM